MRRYSLGARVFPSIIFLGLVALLYLLTIMIMSSYAHASEDITAITKREFIANHPQVVERWELGVLHWKCAANSAHDSDAAIFHSDAGYSIIKEVIKETNFLQAFFPEHQLRKWMPYHDKEFFLGILYADAEAEALREAQNKRISLQDAYKENNCKFLISKQAAVQ